MYAPRVTAAWGLVCWLACGVGDREVNSCRTTMEPRSEVWVHVERPEFWGPGYAQGWRWGLAALFLGWGHSSIWEGWSSISLPRRSVSAVAVGYLSGRSRQFPLQNRLLESTPTNTTESSAVHMAGSLQLS